MKRVPARKLVEILDPPSASNLIRINPYAEADAVHRLLKLAAKRGLEVHSVDRLAAALEIEPVDVASAMGILHWQGRFGFVHKEGRRLKRGEFGFELLKPRKAEKKGSTE